MRRTLIGRPRRPCLGLLQPLTERRELTAERVDFLHQVAFCNSSHCWIARHLGNAADIHRQEQRLHAHHVGPVRRRDMARRADDADPRQGERDYGLCAGQFRRGRRF